MKRGTPDHPKVYALAEELGCSRPTAIGYLELLWHFTATYAPQGNIGKYSDKRIAAALDWRGRPEKLLNSLSTSGWVDAHSVHRWVVHDWSDHVDKATKQKLHRSRKEVIQSPHKDTGKVCAHSETSGSVMVALPEPVPEPEPVPVPEPHQNEFDNQERFDRRWSCWPKKGRTRKPICERLWAEIFLSLDEPSRDDMLARIDEGISAWCASRQFRDGYIFAFSDFLQNRRWPPNEKPESAVAEDLIESGARMPTKEEQDEISRQLSIKAEERWRNEGRI